MKSEYKKNLNFIDVFFVGLGYIVGAGIYSLLNLTTKHGGNYTWLSFLIGGLISLMTAFSYYDLSKLNLKETDSIEYTYIPFSISDTIICKIIIALIIIFLGIVTQSTLITAFSNIIKKFLNNKIPYNIIVFLVISLITIINIYDIKFTTQINMGISVVEILTLIILILLSIPYWKFNNMVGPININGVLYGAFLTIFAYSGFESIPKLTRKTINPTENIPKGIIYSLITTIILYILTSISTNSVLGHNKTSKLVNPLSHVYNLILGKNSKILVDFITLFSVFNTGMLTLLFTSSQLNEFSRDEAISKYISYFRNINSKTKTPINAIIFTSIITLIICLFTNIDNITHITSKLLFTLFALVNLSAIILINKNIIKNKSRYVIYLSGFLSSIYMLFKN